MQLRNCVSTRKVVVLMDTSQSSVAHSMKDAGDNIERQRGWHPKFLANREKRCCVTFVTQDRPRTTFATTKQLQCETCKLLFDIIVRRVLRDARLGAQF